MTIRGVRKPGSICTTSAMRGSFQDQPFEPVGADGPDPHPPLSHGHILPAFGVRLDREPPGAESGYRAAAFLSRAIPDGARPLGGGGFFCKRRGRCQVLAAYRRKHVVTLGGSIIWHVDGRRDTESSSPWP